MRNRILTPKDREIITRYLESGLKLEGFHVFVNRLKKAELRIIEEDLTLIKKFKEAIES